MDPLINHCTTNNITNTTKNPCTSFCCFFCALKEPNPHCRRLALTTFFTAMPFNDESDVLVLSALWNIAMSHPEDTELPLSGVLSCMSRLLAKAIAEPDWLLCHQNIYIPYYAAHVVGSYTIGSSGLAAASAEAGIVESLVSLLGGALTWVEQRVAVRALGHLASYNESFASVLKHKEEVVELAMNIALTCVETIYFEFVAMKMDKRERYHRDLLTRGLGGAELENKKADEWASQLQCWSLYLLSCFATRDVSTHRLICKNVKFLRRLSQMWGGLVNGDSPAGVGLMRILCRSEVGREAIAQCDGVIESLCNLSRSSDDWQYMGIDCLLLLLNDNKTRCKVLDVSSLYLCDLAELRSLSTRTEVGDAITKALLIDFDPQNDELIGLKELWELKVERKQREKLMSKEELRSKRELATAKKKQGNELFCAGNVDGALFVYTEALELCPLKRRRERLVLHSNRAQCYLLLVDAEKAVSDATRALALAKPTNGHAKSLWRRAQAYDMMGMAKESLMDALMFVNVFMDGKMKHGVKGKVPYYAARLINKQMNATGLFAGLVNECRRKGKSSANVYDSDDVDASEEENNGLRGSLLGHVVLPTIDEEQMSEDTDRRYDE